MTVKMSSLKKEVAMRFPSLLKSREERREAKRQARELAMRGWDASLGDTPRASSSSQRHFSMGTGHHLARSFKGHT
jgi:hypothetical protein